MLEQQHNYHSSLENSLWANRVTPKVSLGTSHFIVYGKEHKFPPNVLLLSLQLTYSSRGKA